MDGQLLAVVILVGGALLYLARATWKTWFSKGASCGSGCGKCNAKPEDAPQQQRIALPMTKR